MRVAFPRWPREGLARLNGTLRALEGPLGDSLRELEARISTLVGAEIERVGALDARLRERRPVSDDRFSLALRKGYGRCTIELDPHTRRIMQVRGYCNRYVRPHMRRIIEQWAEREELGFWRYA